MHIDSKGWDNIQARSFDINELPEKVFIEKSGHGYEYSDLPPQNVKWDIDDLLCGPYSRQNFITLFYTLPEVFAPVNEIATRVADATWQLCSNKTDQVDYGNKDFNRLFEQPNPLMSHRQFVWQSVCYDILTGANFEYLNKPSTLPDEISSVLSWWNLPTHKLNIDSKKGVDEYSATELKDFIESISLTRDNGSKRIFDIKNIIPFIKLDLKAGNDISKFRSDLEAGKVAIKNLIAVYEARGVIYIKRGALGFIVSRKSDDSGMISLTKGEKEEAQKEFQNTYGLSNDKHTVGVTSAPVDYISTSMSIKDLMPFDETLADANVLYKVLRVPKHFVPSKDSSTFNNADADTRAFYDDVIIPFAWKYAQSWTKEFSIPNRYIKPDFSHVSVLQDDRKLRAEVDNKNGNTFLQRWENGVITLNEWIMAIDGEKGFGPIYEKKIFELSPEELEQVKSVINMRSLNTKKDETTPTDIESKK